MGGGAGSVFGSVAGDHLRVDTPDPSNLSAEAVTHGDHEAGIAVVHFVPFQTPIKCVSVVPHLLFQTLDAVLEGQDDGLVEDLPLPDG